MSIDFFQFTIRRLVLHKVQPRQNRTPVAPIYGQSLVNMGVDGLQTLQNRIVKAMGNDSSGVEMAIAQHGAGSFFATATELLEADDNALIEGSKLIANMLNDAQATRDLPGGALVVMTGIMGANASRFLAVVKAEMQDGFDLEETAQGLTFQYLNNLMLTPAQRFYKIGLLLERAYNEAGEVGRAPSEFVAILYDQQMSSQETRSAAQYFYRTFLGFEVMDTSKKLTRDFFLFTREFITGRNLGSEKKLDLYDTLRVMLKSDQSLTLSSSGYADSFLAFDEDTRDDYLQFMQTKGFPTQAISKDTSLLDSLLKRRKVKFTSNVTLTAPADQFKDLIQIEESGADSTLVRIKGKLSSEE